MLANLTCSQIRGREWMKQKAAESTVIFLVLYVTHFSPFLPIV